MSETTTETLQTPRRLYRVRTHAGTSGSEPHGSRWLGGVCAGLGRYFELSPTIYRIAFVALALAGGTGILLYLAAWAVIPDEGSEDSLASGLLRRHQDRPIRLVGLAILAFALVLGLSEARFWPSPGNLWLAFALLLGAFVWWQVSERRPVSEGETPPPVKRLPGLLPASLGTIFVAFGVIALLDVTDVTHVDWRIVLAAVVVAIGGLVAAGAATGRSVVGATFLGLLLLAVLAFGLAVRVPLFAGIGDRFDQPSSISDVHSKYELGIGNLTVDLSDLSLPVGETYVKSTVGIGKLRIRVPRNATVDVTGRAQAGKVWLLGRVEHGTHVREDLVDRTGSGRVLVLDARVGLGRVTVERG